MLSQRLASVLVIALVAALPAIAGPIPVASDPIDAFVPILGIPPSQSLPSP